MIELTCGCCGHVETFETAREAFEAGWDEPVHMPSWPVSCPLCPGTAQLGLLDHTGAHERWAREGRPASFAEQIEKGDLPALTPEDIAATERKLAEILRMDKP